MTEDAAAEILISSQALAWPGFAVTRGRGGANTECREFGLPMHFVAVNVDDAPLHFDAKPSRRFRRVIMPPGTAWTLPAGEGVWHRNHMVCHFASVALDPAYFARLVGGSGGEPAADGDAVPALRLNYTIDSPPLTHLIHALTLEAALGGPAGLAFAETLALGVALQLAKHCGAPVTRSPRITGGLSREARRRVLELIDTQIQTGGRAADVRLEELAREAGLSPSYFLRVFKRTSGMPPHRYVLRRRLEHARRLLDRPDLRLSEIAILTGFADQSHFTRLFRREFGITPGAVRRTPAPGEGS